MIRLHDARHGFGSRLIDLGVPIAVVSKVMGHSSPDITMSIYAHALKDGADERVRAATVAAGL